MLLTVQQSYALLEKFGVYVNECCDKCGAIAAVFPVSKGTHGGVCKRFTRKNGLGVWCSRQCRDGIEAREPGTCRQCRAKLPDGKRRGALFCDDACRKAFRRQNDTVQAPETLKLSRTKPSIYAAFCIGKGQAGISGHPRFLGELQD